MIYQFSPFYDENLVLDIASKETKKYGGIIHITESNRTFQNTKKEYNYDGDNDNVVYHKFDASKIFKPVNKWGLLQLYHYRFSENDYKKTTLLAPSWFNEGYSRDIACSWIKPKDDDFVILCDVDEIIDSSKIDNILNIVKEKGIVTGKMYHTLFYFNLFSSSVGGQPIGHIDYL